MLVTSLKPWLLRLATTYQLPSVDRAMRRTCHTQTILLTQ